MVIGHCNCPAALYKFIYNMPVFFFFSGYFFSTSKLMYPRDYLKKKVKALWWPFVKYSTFFLLIHNLLYGVYFEQEYYTLTKIIKNALLIPFMFGNDPLIGGYWFLNNLFYSILLVVGISLVIKKRFPDVEDNVLSIIMVVISVIVFILSQLIFNITDMSQMSIVVSLCFSLSCYSLGYLFSANDLFDKIMNPTWYCALLAGLALYLSSRYYSILRPFTDASVVSMVYVLIMALIGIYFTYSIAHFFNMYCGGQGVLRFLGYNTLTILTWHFLSLKVLDMALVFIHGMPMSSMVSLQHLPTDMFIKNGWILYAIVGVGLPMCGICVKRYIIENIDMGK